MPKRKGYSRSAGSKRRRTTVSTRRRAFRSPQYIRPRTRRDFSRRKDIAKFTHNSSWTWHPEEGTGIGPVGSVCDQTCFMTINANNPFQVFHKGNEQPPSSGQTYTVRDGYGGNGKLIRDGVGESSPGDTALNLATGLFETPTNPNGAYNQPMPRNSCDTIDEWIGLDPEQHRYKSGVVKSCKVTARISPKQDSFLREDDGGNSHIGIRPTQVGTNFYIGDAEDVTYMGSDQAAPIRNGELKKLPHVHLGQTRLSNHTGGGNRRCTFLSHSVSTARAFGVKDVEDNEDLSFTVVDIPQPNPSGTDYGPNKRNYIQIAWRSIQDALVNMDGYMEVEPSGEPGPSVARAKRLGSFKIDIRVEYVVVMKDALPRSNVPRPLFIGRAPWSKKHGRKNPMSKFYSNFGPGFHAKKGMSNMWKIFKMGMPAYRWYY